MYLTDTASSDSSFPYGYILLSTAVVTSSCDHRLIHKAHSKMKPGCQDIIQGSGIIGRVT